jgi:predicted kinase
VEAVLLIGIQASGKSTFCRQRLYDTHVRINLDMLRTRRREELLLRACLDGKIRFVVDNTNVTRADRARYLAPAREAGFRTVGYYFAGSIAAALRRNAARAGRAHVGAWAIRRTEKRMEPPAFDEGFDELYLARPDPAGGFIVEAIPPPSTTGGPRSR